VLDGVGVGRGYVLTLVLVIAAGHASGCSWAIVEPLPQGALRQGDSADSVYQVPGSAVGDTVIATLTGAGAVTSWVVGFVPFSCSPDSECGTAQGLRNLVGGSWAGS